MGGNERRREAMPASARTARNFRRSIGSLALIAFLFSAIVALLIEEHRGTTAKPEPRPVKPHHLADPDLPEAAYPRSALPSTAVSRKESLRTANVCGLGPVTVKSDNPNLASAVSTEVDRRTAKAAAAWMATLRDSDDLMVRAAGLLLDGHTVGDRLVTSMSAASGLGYSSVDTNDGFATAHQGLSGTGCGRLRSAGSCLDQRARCVLAPCKGNS